MKVFKICVECFVSRNTNGMTNIEQRMHVRFDSAILCLLCKRYTTRFVQVFYKPENICMMENTIEALKQRCVQLEAKCEVLENHIKYAPGGEGEFKALCSFYKAVMDSEIK